MAYRDLREFMDALKKAGELVEIETEVDWYLEVGAIIRRTYEIGTPGVHFKKIRSYSKDYSACFIYQFTLSLPGNKRLTP